MTIGGQFMTKIDAKRRCPASAGVSVREKQSFKGSILLLFGISLTLSPAFAQAQEFDIDAGPAVAGLSEFAAQADVSVVYTYDAVDGLETNKVEGVYEPDQALNLLLAGTSLSAYEGDGGAFAILAREERGDSESKNLGAMPVLMAQSTPQTTSTEMSSGSDDGGTSIVTGKVTDARTGANLKGAKVTIEETGQWASTNDLGEFRFVNVPTGSATLTVSYLGYAGQSAVIGVRSESTAQNFALRGGSEIEEIVVFGQRSARALALNMERTAENTSTVISSDLLGQFGGTTISDSLRRAAGVAFQKDALSGEGSNIIVRGLQPDLNQIQLNGVNLPDGSGLNRSASLNNILSDSISSVTVSKTLLPNQESAGTGGLVEIETASALERGDRYLSLSLEGTDRGGDYGDGFLFSATGSKAFGNRDQFGVLLSVQHRQLIVRTFDYDANLRFGAYLPNAADGSPATDLSRLDPRLPFPIAGGDDNVYINSTTYDFGDTDTENTTVNLGFEWAPDSSLNVRADYVFAAVDQENFSQKLNIGGGFPFSLPVPALGGETRVIQTLDLSVFGFPLPNPDETVALTRSQGFRYIPDLSNDTHSISIQADKSFDRWQLSGGFGYSEAESEIINISAGYNFFGDDFFSFNLADPNVTLDPSLFVEDLGTYTSAWAPRTGDGFPAPLLTPAGFDYLNSIGEEAVLDAVGFRRDRSVGETSVLEFDVSARYEPEIEYLTYVEVGLDYGQSKFADFNGFRDGDRVFSDQFKPAVFNGVTLADLAITGTSAIDYSELSGVNGALEYIDGSGIRPFLNNLDEFAAANPDLLTLLQSERNPLSADQDTTEEELAAYVMARVDINNFEIIGGVRLSSVNVEARFPDGPQILDVNNNPDLDFADRFTRLFEQDATVTEYLPRVLVNYRPNENLIFRGGYYSSVARPRIRDLSSERSITLSLAPVFGPNNDRPRLLVVQGNPGLEPQYSHNFDFSAEKYFDDIGVLKAGLFYKRFDNFIEFNQRSGDQLLDGVELPDDPRFDDVVNNPQNYEISVSLPRNSDDAAEIWGLEFSAERQFSFLPGVWNGFGVFANYTYTDSARDIVQVWQAAPDGPEEIVLRDEPFFQSPEHSGTIGITYDKYGINSSLFYTEQSETRTRVLPTNFSLSPYTDSISTLDARFEYAFERSGAVVALFIEGRDLLKDEEDPDTQQYFGGEGATPRYYSSGAFRGGRSFSAGVRLIF